MNFNIANREIGPGAPSFVIAEIGSNHNQDFDLALKLIDVAAEAGVDAVKFQTFKAAEHFSKYAELPAYLNDYKNLHALIESLELNRDWQAALKSYAEEKGVLFFSSPCDYEAVDGLEKINVPAHKVASFDLTDLDLIRYIAKTGKPIILSTGLANWMEIQRAVDTCHAEGNFQVALLQCTSLYPAPIHLSNLKAMHSMKEAFQVVTGYSDHTMGDLIAVSAVAMGASIIEKHITLDRRLPGPDHPFAMEPEELKIMMEKIRQVEEAMGNGIKNGPRQEELESYEKARRSLHANRDILRGEIITEDCLKTKRPGRGIEPHLKNIVIGKAAKTDIKADHWISWDMV